MQPTGLPDIEHDPERQRFLLTLEGQQARLDYRRLPGTLAITHTGVPEAIGGRGVAAALVEAALAFARAEGLGVVPECSYAAAYLRRHPEHRDLLA